MAIDRMEIHSHTCYSNLRFYDCINKVEDLIKYGIDIGLKGIAITDHESLGAHILIDKLQDKYKETNPDFKIARGNEIYLIPENSIKEVYRHFILIATDSIGHRMLRELSTAAWGASKVTKGQTRVPTYPEEVEKVLKQFGQGHLHASTACIAGRLAQDALKLHKAKQKGDEVARKKASDDVIYFINWCMDTFGRDNFSLEVAPVPTPEQIVVNNYIKEFADHFDLPVCIGTDAHYLSPKERYAHQAFINARDDRAETIYQYAYLQTEDEIRENLKDTNLNYEELCANSMAIYDKCQYYSLKHNQIVPQVSVPDFPKKKIEVPNAPILSGLYESDNEQERYWVNYCMDELKNRNINTQEYIDELEVEADTMRTIGEKLDTCIFSYPIFLKKYLDLIWDCGSTVGVGRGSSCAGLNHYLMNITQLDPIKYNLPYYWRFLNKERVELPDIDIDLCPSKRPELFKRIREERGELGCVQVCTFGTISSRAAVKISCRGYRSDKYPEGIPLEEAEYMTSLIPSERGFVWTIEDCLNGNEEKDRKPVQQFINEVSRYEGLEDILLHISGIVNQRGIHASGVNFYDDEPCKTAAFMKAKDGSWVTQYSLHDAEYAGDTKYDLLVTEVQDVITQCIELLQENDQISKDLTLKEVYNKYLHPDVIDFNDPEIWNKIETGRTLKLFQFDGAVGRQAAKMLKPKSLEELANVNSIMRLMPEKKGAETSSQRYQRMKQDISQWYQEMELAGLSDAEVKILEPHYLPAYGTPNSQEQLMILVMDKNICGLSLKQANDLRKVIGKKQMDRIPEMRELITSQAQNPILGNYVWSTAALPQLGYSFSQLHATAYSAIGVQCAVLASKFPEVYWNTACLRVDAGLEEDDSSNYDKIAKAVGNIQNAGVNILPVNINKSQYFFTPEESTNSIYFGLKAVNGLTNDSIGDIVDQQPYTSFKDFESKNPIRITGMLALIKSGAFDEFGNRIEIMEEFIEERADTKKRLTLANGNMLIEFGLFPQELDFERRLYVFNKLLRKECKLQGGKYFSLLDNYYDFYSQYFDINETEYVENVIAIDKNKWQKMYTKAIAPFKDYIKEHQEELLKQLNNALFQQTWDKYAAGSISKWEMDAMNYYYHEHELAGVDKARYGIQEFNSLPYEPKVLRMVNKGKNKFPIYQHTKIVGTVIGKNIAASTISILTPNSGVVDARINRNVFADYNKRIQDTGADGKNFIAEKGWFDRGTLIMLNGYRRNDTFQVMSSRKKGQKPIYKIISIGNDGTLEVESERYDERMFNAL